MQQIFFQSSLPRAGSTLLQNIMGQNPNFYVTPTSGLCDLVLGTRIGYTENHESKAGDLELWKNGFYSYCRQGMYGYVSSITDKPYFLDKSRMWMGYYPLMTNILPNPKIIVMVRDLRAVFASMEKKFRQNPDLADPILNNVSLEGITTDSRVMQWANSRPIGQTLLKLYQAILDKSAENFLFVRYEDLCSNPHDVIKSIYRYLEIEEYQHNFDFIPQITVENDTVHGIYGDHIIRNKLEMEREDYREVLGDSACNWIVSNFKWYFNLFGYS
jgi:sulfotransferase